MPRKTQQPKPSSPPSLDHKLFFLRRDMRDEFEHRLSSLKSETQAQYKLDADALRKHQWRYFKIALSVLAFLGLTSVGGIYTAFRLASSQVDQALDREVKAVQEKVAQRLDEEFKTDRIRTLIAQTAEKYTQGDIQRYIAGRVDSAMMPTQRSLDARLHQFDQQLNYINALVDLNELETKARNGSRTAFDKLRAVSQGNDRLSNSARDRLTAVKTVFAVLRIPQYVMIGDVSAMKNGKPVDFNSLSAAEMAFLLNDKNASLDQVHKMMTHMMNKSSQELTPHLINLLRNSENLAACVTSCVLLSNWHGDKADIFEFSQWIQVFK